MPENLLPLIGDRYETQRKLSEGGTGEVFLALDRRTAREVAVKSIKPGIADPQARKKALSLLEHEAAMLRQFSHPGIVKILDCFSDDVAVYLVMDLVQGHSLRDLLALRQALPVRQVLHIGSQLCDVLSYLHGRQIIYRDLKPGNVMIDDDGNIVLIDFGLARVDRSGDKTSTLLQGVTPGYAPPEQYQQKATTDARSDLYALGATLYTLLTGRVPPSSLMLAAKSEKLTEIRSINPDVPYALEGLIQGLMEPRREKRPASVTQVRRSLDTLLTALAPAARLSLPLVAVPSAPSPEPVSVRPSEPAPVGTPVRELPVAGRLPLRSLGHFSLGAIHLTKTENRIPAVILFPEPERLAEAEACLERASAEGVLQVTWDRSEHLNGGAALLVLENNLFREVLQRGVRALQERLDGAEPPPKPARQSPVASVIEPLAASPSWFAPEIAAPIPDASPASDWHRQYRLSGVGRLLAGLRFLVSYWLIPSLVVLTLYWFIPSTVVLACESALFAAVVMAGWVFRHRLLTDLLVDRHGLHVLNSSLVVEWLPWMQVRFMEVGALGIRFPTGLRIYKVYEDFGDLVAVLKAGPPA